MNTPANPMMIQNWKESVTFAEHGPSITILMDTPHLKALLVGLRADQAIPVHPSPEAIYHFVQGTGTMTVDDETYSVEPGTTVLVPDGSRRGIAAQTDIVFIGTTRPAVAEASADPE